MIRCFLTTVDNPYSPYEQFEDWYRFDTDKGYNSSGLLMRMAYTSDQLTDAENAYEIEQAMMTSITSFSRTTMMSGALDMTLIMPRTL